MIRRLRNISLCLIFAATCVLFSACRSYNASVWRTVDFVSAPEGATLFINGKNCGLTPRTERLAKSGNYEVRFSKPGYFDEDVVLESFVAEDGRPDILDSVDVALVKITPESLSLRERLERERTAQSESDQNSGNATPQPVVAVTPENEASSMSPAAKEFASRPKPTDFTDFRLQEKALKRLFRRGEITEAEYNSLHEALYNSYNENRLLKAPRLGTYEKAL